MPAHLANWVIDLKDVKPLQAWRSMRALLADPDNTAEVFKIIEALKGASLARAVERMRATPEGRDMLQRKPQILPVLSDRDALRAMPEGSVGRAYLKFVETQDLSAEGLVAASEEAPRGRAIDPDVNWLGNRLRDIHDLQHVLTGYGRDPLGELCLLSFMVTQVPNRGIAFIVFMAKRRFRENAPQIDIDACVAEGRRIADATTWLPAVNWEQRLAEPLVQMRAELGIVKPTLYRNSLASFASVEKAA
jgi:ubiquinone biosynthesis protein COQ4